MKYFIKILFLIILILIAFSSVAIAETRADDNIKLNYEHIFLPLNGQEMNNIYIYDPVFKQSIAVNSRQIGINELSKSISSESINKYKGLIISGAIVTGLGLVSGLVSIMILIADIYVYGNDREYYTAGIISFSIIGLVLSVPATPLWIVGAVGYAREKKRMNAELTNNENGVGLRLSW